MKAQSPDYYGTFLDRWAWSNASPAERRIRSRVYDRVFSGDFIVEQKVHAIDVCIGHPVRATGVGGRKVRQDPGPVHGQYNVVFYYPDDVHVTLSSTQFDKGWWNVNERFGQQRWSESHYSGPVAIYGDKPRHWDAGKSAEKSEPTQSSAPGTFHDNAAEADPEKHKAFAESIISGNFHNQARPGR